MENITSIGRGKYSEIVFIAVVFFSQNISKSGNGRFIYIYIYAHMGFPGGSDGKEFACSTGYPVLFPESGRSSEEGNGYPL